MDHIKRQCKNAVKQFSDVGIWVGDCGMHNILYDRETCKDTLVDFEVIGECTEETRRQLDGPEMIAIFGADVEVDNIIGG